MIYLIQVTNSQLIPAFLTVLRHSSQLCVNHIQVIIIFPRNSYKYFSSHAFWFANKYSINVKIFPRLPYCFTYLLNFLLHFIPNIISICQSPYGYLGFQSKNFRRIIFVGDGFGIKSMQPMKHGKVKGLTKRNTSFPRFMYYPIFYSKSLQEKGICADLSLYKFVSQSDLFDMFKLGLPLFKQSNPIDSFLLAFDSILIIAPSNFSENGRITLKSEVLLYIDDLNILLKSYLYSRTLVIIKPHPYGSPQKTSMLSNLIHSRFPSVSVFDEPSRMPLEQYLHLLTTKLSPSFNAEDLTLLTYQTSWPSLISLEINIKIRVGFSNDKYFDCFEYESAIQRQSYQEMIPSNLLIK